MLLPSDIFLSDSSCVFSFLSISSAFCGWLVGHQNGKPFPRLLISLEDQLYLWRFNVHRLLLFSHRLTPPSLPRLRHTFFRPFFKPKKTFNSSKKSWLDLVSIKERRGGEVVSLDGSGLLLLLAVRVVRHLDRLLVVHVRRSENQDSTPHILLLLSLS